MARLRKAMPPYCLEIIMSAPATKKRRGAGFTLDRLPHDILPVCLSFLTPEDFMRWSRTATGMRASLLLAMANSPVATKLATAMMTLVLRSHAFRDEANREWEWNYMTFHGRFHPPRHMGDQLTPYATYIELKYMEYYVLSQHVVNRATGNAHSHSPEWTYAQVTWVQNRLHLLQRIREDAGRQLLPCWCNSRLCQSLEQLDDADMDIGMVQQIHNANWVGVLSFAQGRYGYESELRQLIDTQAVPHAGTRHAPVFADASRFHHLV